MEADPGEEDRIFKPVDLARFQNGVDTMSDNHLLSAFPRITLRLNNAKAAMPGWLDGRGITRYVPVAGVNIFLPVGIKYTPIPAVPQEKYARMDGLGP